jgi:hypothetical protein
MVVASDLSRANLAAADLTGTLLLGVKLSNTNLSGASLDETVMADCRTLHEAIGLTALKHVAPSTLDVRTLRACAAHLPESFLQDMGYTPEEIHHLKALYSGPVP